MKDKYLNALIAIEADFSLGLLVPQTYDNFDVEAFNRDVDMFSEFVWNLRNDNYVIVEKVELEQGNFF